MTRYGSLRERDTTLRLVVLAVSVLLALAMQGCSRINSPSSAGGPGVASETLYGQIESLNGSILTVTMMADLGPNALCPPTPEQTASDVSGSDSPTSSVPGGQVAQPAPSDGAAQQIFLDVTGGPRRFTIAQDAKIVDPSGNAVAVAELREGAIVMINLARSTGKADEITILNPGDAPPNPAPQGALPASEFVPEAQDGN